MNFQERTADLLYKAVKRAVVTPSYIEQGDLIVITEEDNDSVGIVDSLETTGSATSITLKTASGLKTLQVDDTNFIHVIQKAAMLDLRKHHQYERKDEESNKEVDMIKKLKGDHKERPQFTDEKSDKSALPTSKISLSLRKEKES